MINNNSRHSIIKKFGIVRQSSFKNNDIPFTDPDDLMSPDINLQCTNMQKTETSLKDNIINYAESIKDNNIDFNKLSGIYICIYSIITTYPTPYIQYLLQENNIHELSFLYIKFKHNQDYVKQVYNAILDLFNGEILIRDINFKFNILFREKGYAFFEITSPNKFATFKYTPLITDIINIKTLYDLIIDEAIVDLFLHNKDLLFLKNEKQKHYNVPYSFYYTNTIKIINLYDSIGYPRNIKIRPYDIMQELCGKNKECNKISRFIHFEYDKIIHDNSDVYVLLTDHNIKLY